METLNEVNELLTTTLGDLDDDRVMPILMDIARNNELNMNVRNQAIEKIAKADKIAGTVTTEKDVDEMIQMGARLVTT